VVFEALQSKEQYLQARQRMQERGIDCADRLSFVESLLERYGKLPRVKLGDVLKSWDVLKSVQFIEEKLDKSAAVLDIGAFGSEILIVLHRLGYNNLTGIDLSTLADYNISCFTGKRCGIVSTSYLFYSKLV
jgi:2-polyprenyl-3-methyl-5-hydroxy-6-metoxy-1,4-benzoquinol methylase